jgi:hypothetical protein
MNKCGTVESMDRKEKEKQGTILLEKHEKHRVGRVLSFFSSRRNWDSPTPLAAGECAPPPFGPGGRHIRLRLKE